MNKFQSCKTASMSKGKRNNDCSHCAILPPEIVADVLSRLPVKSLCRFKCVSPSWKTLISSPDFARTHLNRTTPITLNTSTATSFSCPPLISTPSISLLTFPSPQNWIFLRSNNTSTSCCTISWALVMACFCFPFKVTFPSSCSAKKKTSNLFLLNPSTRECDKLPPLPFVLDPGERGGFYMFGYGLGYDSSRDDYKVVMLSYYVSKSEFESVSSTLSDMTMVAVYSLKTNAWTRIQDAHYIPDRCTAGVYYNGCLHWLCRRDGSYLMFVLDLADEIFREVPLLASVVHDESVDFHEVVIVGDCLCLVCERDSGLVEVWMMMEFGVSASWSKVMIDIHNIINMYIHGLLAEDEFLLTGNTSREDKLVVYNPKKGKLRDIMVHGIPTSFFTRRTYVESLVSPNQCNHGEGTGKQG